MEGEGGARGEGLDEGFRRVDLREVLLDGGGLRGVDDEGHVSEMVQVERVEGIEEQWTVAKR